jgi:superfamily II RNA helicase
MVKVCQNTYPKKDENIYGEYFQWFPYELSPFQKYSIQATVEGHHSLVTAHTGSGKSLPAEFAIQYFKKQNKKVIYTSPIKALSNQKYYEFTQKYPHISFGLITGDIKINPTADVLIMTAEILLNYLFKQTDETTQQNLQFQMDIQNELACVVMDEIHYINDRDRGSVWEKTILILPPHIQMIMLSATIDSPVTFAKWCERGEDSIKKVWLSSTTHRIVPLLHYGFLVTNEAFFKKVKDKTVQKYVRDNTLNMITLKTDDGRYLEEGYKLLTKTKKLLEDNDVMPKRAHVLNQLCGFLKEREMFPAIAFVFSRKNVELFAKEITTNLLEDDSKIPYTVRRECEQIIRKLPNYLEYMNLPEYNQLVSLLEKGVGIHHSGMIPVLREIVELMISKKYIKILFATESFAIGLNCPIRTAIFTSLTKFDGSGDRYLLPHEYNQAASRCGRRGIDTVGHVIHCNNLFTMPSQLEYKTMLCGGAQKLSSKLRISVPFVLNLIQQYGNEVGVLDFINKTMIRKELDQDQDNIKTRIETIENHIRMAKNSLTLIRTPVEACQEYLILMKTLDNLTSKKRKDGERKIQNLIDQHKYILGDSGLVDNLTKLEIEIDDAQKDLAYGDLYFALKIEKICYLLTKCDFIWPKDIVDNTQIFALTKKGQIACSMAEINPILMSEFLVKSNYMSNMNKVQILQFLSCFTDIKVKMDCRSIVPMTNDTVILDAISHIQLAINYYYQYSSEQNITISNNGTENDLELMFDLINIIDKWCDCTDEDQCKWFVQSQLLPKDISIGDFTKAILKISTMTKELMNVAEQFEDMLPFLSKLGDIDSMILKYITTAQSLYV